MRIENRVWVAIVVILFAGIPFIPVDLSTIKVRHTRSAQCQVSVPQPNDTGWSNAYTTLNNQSALVPVWWFFMHAISKAVTGGGGGDSLRDGPAADAHGRGCHAHRRPGAGPGGGRLRARLLRPVARQAVHEPAHALRRADERRDLDRVELLPGQRGLLRHLPLQHARTAWPYDATRDAGWPRWTAAGLSHLPAVVVGRRQRPARACWPRSIPTC